MSTFFTVGGVRLHYHEWGDPTALPLVLLHGGAAQAHWWDHLAPALAEHSYVVALDLRGHGDSSWVSPPAYEIEDYVGDVEAILAALHLVSPVLIGHSLGGFVALSYAARSAKALSGLIVVDIGFRLKSNRMMRLLRNLPAPVYQDETDLLRRFQLLPGETTASSTLLHHIARTSVQPLETGGFTLKFDRATMVRKPCDLSPVLSQITCPTLVLRGSHSQHLSMATLTDMVHRCPGARGREISDAGHHVLLDNPTAFLHAVRDFLREEVEGHR